MIDLDEAWRWYTSTRSSLTSFARLGWKHWDQLWDQLPEESSLRRDDEFRSLDSEKIIEDSGLGIRHLDDFAVMVLFSVFESNVRDRVIKRIEAERAELRLELLGGVIDATLRDLRTKAFYRILDLFKGVDHGLVKEVNQVRRYRNWVAHGRRSAPPSDMTPKKAYERLSRFIEAMTGN